MPGKPSQWKKIASYSDFSIRCIFNCRFGNSRHQSLANATSCQKAATTDKTGSDAAEAVQSKLPTTTNCLVFTELITARLYRSIDSPRHVRHCYLNVLSGYTEKKKLKLQTMNYPHYQQNRALTATYFRPLTWKNIKQSPVKALIITCHHFNAEKSNNWDKVYYGNSLYGVRKPKSSIVS